MLKRRWIVGTAKYGLGLALLAFVIWRYWEPPPDTGHPGLRDALQRAPNLVPLAAAIACWTFSLFLTFLRWYVLVRAQELPFTVTNAVRLGLVGYFLSTFLPGSIGGDIVKATFLAREQRRRTVAVSTVLIDRGIGLWGLCGLVAILGSFFWINGLLPAGTIDVTQRIVRISLWLIAGTAVLWVFLGVLPVRRAEKFAWRLSRIPKIGHSAVEFWNAVRLYRNKGKSVGLALGMAIVGHVGFVFTFYFAALTLLPPEENIPTVVEHFLIVPIGMATEAIPLSPGGIGVGEFAFSELYGRLGFVPADGVFASLVRRMIWWGVGLVGYVMYLRMKPVIRAAEQIDAELSATKS